MKRIVLVTLMLLSTNVSAHHPPEEIANDKASSLSVRYSFRSLSYATASTIAAVGVLSPFSRLKFGVEVPVVFGSFSDGNVSGLSDIALHTSVSVLKSEMHSTAAIGSVGIPSGDERSGLGSGHLDARVGVRTEFGFSNFATASLTTALSTSVGSSHRHSHEDGVVHDHSVSPWLPAATLRAPLAPHAQKQLSNVLGFRLKLHPVTARIVADTRFVLDNGRFIARLGSGLGFRLSEALEAAADASVPVTRFRYVDTEVSTTISYRF